MKRLFDVSVSALALIVLAPLIGAVAFAIWFNMGRPIFFRQERPGLGGKPFRILKFRTMEVPRADGVDTSDGARLTRLGRFLRSTSIDELPELWNVLVGEMSLVGPRPLLMDYLTRYSPYQSRRHEVRPGLTGWAQVNGRNTVGWGQRLALDIWYVDNRSFWLDIRILLKTFVLVFAREGISAPGFATMPEFVGDESSSDNRCPAPDQEGRNQSRSAR